MPEPAQRRGWRERIEPGLYRAHALACPRSGDRKTCRRCSCPYVIVVPGDRPGTTRQVRHAGPISAARTERRRLMAAGRIEPPPEQHEPAEIATVRDLARAYLVAHDGVRAASTLQTYNGAYRRSIDPHLGTVPLAELTRGRVTAWLGVLAQTRSRHAIWKAHTTLRTMLAYGATEGLVEANPASGQRLPQGTSSPGAAPRARRVLRLEQIAALIEAAQLSRSPVDALRLELMVRMSAECGLRLGEVVGLRWGDVELAERRVNVRRAIYQPPGRNGERPVRVEKPPKAGRAATVALTSGLARLLGEWFSLSVVETGANASGYVFPARDGGPMGIYTPNQALGRLCRRADLVDHQGKPLLSWHGLRHSCASNMLAAGVPLPDVSAQLRHADVSVTARVYAHSLGHDRLQAAVSAFDILETSRTLREDVAGNAPTRTKRPLAGDSATRAGDS